MQITSSDSNLVRSIQSINSFIDGNDIIANGNDFVNLYTTIKNDLIQIGLNRKTTFYQKRIEKLPEIHPVEIDEYLKKRSKEKHIFLIIGGYLFYFLDKIFTLIRTKGKSATDIEGKLHLIKQLNITFISTIEKPGLEHLVENSR